jgi:hypothetical protein
MRYLTGVLVFVLLAASGGEPAHALAGAPPPGQPYVITGVVIGLGRGMLTLRLDGGAVATFQLVEGTALPVADREVLTPGRRVQLWVLGVAGGSAVVLRVLGRGAPGGRAPDEPGPLRGLVLTYDGRTATLLTEQNVLYTVLTTATSRVRGGEVLPQAVVQVEGTRNSDGSISARTITVQFDPRASTRVRGVIALVWPEVGFVLTDGTVVILREDAWLVRGTALRPTGALAAGMAVTVLGIGSPPYVSARVVAISF